MVTFGVDVFKRSETRVNPLDGTLKDFELEDYEGIVKIQDRSRNQTILIPIGGAISVKEVNERALLCLKSIQDDLNDTIELIKGQI